MYFCFEVDGLGCAVELEMIVVSREWRGGFCAPGHEGSEPRGGNDAEEAEGLPESGRG